MSMVVVLMFSLLKPACSRWGTWVSWKSLTDTVSWSKRGRSQLYHLPWNYHSSEFMLHPAHPAGGWGGLCVPLLDNFIHAKTLCDAGLSVNQDVPQTSCRCCRTWSWAARPRKSGCSRWGRHQASASCGHDPGKQTQTQLSQPCVAVRPPYVHQITPRTWPVPPVHDQCHQSLILFILSLNHF